MATKKTDEDLKAAEPDLGLVDTIVSGPAARDHSDPVVDPIIRLEARVWAANRIKSPAAFIAWARSQGARGPKAAAEWAALHATFSKSKPAK